MKTHQPWHKYLQLIRDSEMPIYKIAEKSGIVKNTINSWLHHGRTPTIANLAAVLNVIGYELEITKND